MDVLEKICADKRDHIEQQKERFSLSDLEKRIEKTSAPRGFAKALHDSYEQNHRPALIAEIKKASPSAGVIRPDFDPERLAQIYADNGATCLSVLTDSSYFQGNDSYIAKVQNKVALPVLRKDFMLEPYQIFESRALGADCVLLIMAALSDDQAANLYTLARSLEMDVLVETHNEEEMQRALDLGADMIGINNRNLKTLKVDLETGFRMRSMMSDDILAVAESGIKTHEDVNRLTESSFQAMLVGESLMRQDDLGQAVRALLTDA